jgi:hypothetical protein
MTMIVRIWRGRSISENADAYRRHATETVFPALAKFPGHAGAYLLTRLIGGEIEFLAVTLWTSLDAIKLFAGSDPNVAIVEPEARAVLSEFDDFVRNYEVASHEGCRCDHHVCI